MRAQRTYVVAAVSYQVDQAMGTLKAFEAESFPNQNLTSVLAYFDVGICKTQLAALALRPR